MNKKAASQRIVTTKLASKKRLVPANPTPTFVDNKRKKSEKQLSAKQRDMVLINAAKKEIDLKTNIAMV